MRITGKLLVCVIGPIFTLVCTWVVWCTSNVYSFQEVVHNQPKLEKKIDQLCVFYNIAVFVF